MGGEHRPPRRRSVAHAPPPLNPRAARAARPAPRRRPVASGLTPLAPPSAGDAHHPSGHNATRLGFQGQQILDVVRKELRAPRLIPRQRLQSVPVVQPSVVGEQTRHIIIKQVRVSAGDEIGELRPFAEASFGPLDDPRSVHRRLSAVARKAKVAVMQPLVTTICVEFAHIVSFVVLPCGGNRPRHQTVAPAVPRLNPGAVCCGPSRPAPRRRPVARGPAPLAPPRRGPHRAPRPPTSSCGSAPAPAQPPANAEQPEPRCHRTGEGRYAPQ